MEKNVMIRRKLYLLTEKCKLIVRSCGQDRTDEVLAGMGDYTAAITDILPEVPFFNTVEFLNLLQKTLIAMTKPDIEAIRTILHDDMIPVFEKLYKDPAHDTKEDAAEKNGVRSAAKETAKRFDSYSAAAGQAGRTESFWDESEAGKWIETIEYDGRDRAVCMFGRGDGVCERKLRERLSPGSILLVYEPEKADPIGFRDELQTRIDFYRQESLLICAHPLYREIFRNEYAQFIHLINENRTRVMVNKNTMARFRENASKNVITNLGMLENANLVSDLKKILPNDVPVIIVSAGPSLDKNIELLKRAKGHCLIFAVDTAMKYMLAHDIIPDLGITIEPIKPMANYEDPRCFAVPHVFDCESNPEIVSKHTARKFIYNCRDYVKRLLLGLGKEVPGDIASGGSVATAAFAICYQLGIRRIIMIGQDLAYSGEATHAGGVESKGINNDIGYEMIDGIDGGKVRTRTDWLAYLKWFENAIDLMQDMGRDMQVIDATEGGALIHGSRVMTLADAIDEYCVLEYDFAAELKKLPLLLKPYEIEKLGKLVERSALELGPVGDAARDAVRLCEEELEKLLKNEKTDAADPGSGDEDKLEYESVMKELTRARITCEKALLYPLINNYAVTGIAEDVSRIRLERSGTESELLQQKLAFEAIADACGYFKTIMETYLDSQK